MQNGKGELAEAKNFTITWVLQSFRFTAAKIDNGHESGK